MIKTYAEGSLFFLSVIIFQSIAILPRYSVFSRHEEIVLFVRCSAFSCGSGFMQQPKTRYETRTQKLQLSYMGLSVLRHG